MIVLLLAMTGLPAFAQVRLKVTPNPKLATFDRIWLTWGATTSKRVGVSSGPVGDINGDGLGDFAIFSSAPSEWSVYYGDTLGPKITPVWRFEGGRGQEPVEEPVVGDFWGTGRKAVGFLRDDESSFNSTERSTLQFFRTESFALADTEAATWYSWRGNEPYPEWVTNPYKYAAADIDGDGADEFIVFNWATFVGGTIDRHLDRHLEVYIYKGGPAFQATSPAAVLRDTVAPGFDGYPDGGVADLDGDGAIDIFMIKDYQVPFSGLRFTMDIYFGPHDLAEQNRQPDRTIPFPAPWVVTLDLDGDGILDIASGAMDLYLSSTGKSARSRSYRSEDAEVHLDSFKIRPTGLRRGGYLNSRKYETLMLVTQDAVYGLTGTAGGRDSTYDGYLISGSESLDHGQPIGDCNGDGWEDYLSSGALSGTGAAFILAGGPYIPR